MEGEEHNIDNEEIVAGPFSRGVWDEISFEKSGTGPIEPPFLSQPRNASLSPRKTAHNDGILDDLEAETKT